MNDVVIASSAADARAAEAVEAHHAQMSGALAVQTEALVAAVGVPDVAAAEQARQRLVEWCNHELLPHAEAEEQALYPVARQAPDGRLLVDGMLAEHRVIGDLVRNLAGATDLVRAAATATALRVLFEVHLAKENDLVIPFLLRMPGVSVADLLEGMHEVLGGHDHDHGHGEQESGGCGSGGGHSCGCGETDPDTLPELDARTIPHAIRHATIFGALEAVRPGGGMILVAPHDPLPLLAQIGDRWPGLFAIDYLESGPEAWRLTLVRSAS